MSLPLQPGDEVLERRRRHWVCIYPRLFLMGFVAAAPPAGLFVVLRRLDLLADRGWQVAGAVSAVWLLYWGLRMFLAKYRYDNDFWVITRRRVIDTSSRHPLHVHTSAADITDIEDVTVTSSGLLATLFGFGDIECHTASSQENFSLRSIPRPHELQSLVNRLRNELRGR